jgi:hypothetical protein
VTEAELLKIGHDLPRVLAHAETAGWPTQHPADHFLLKVIDRCYRHQKQLQYHRARELRMPLLRPVRARHFAAYNLAAISEELTSKLLRLSGRTDSTSLKIGALNAMTQALQQSAPKHRIWWRELFRLKNTIKHMDSGADRIILDEKYILLNELGDWRVLDAPPTLSKTADGHVLQCPIGPSFPRMRAQDLPRDFAMPAATNDIFGGKGRIAVVSGVAALPQRIRSCLSLLPGESPMHPRAGAKLVEYFRAFQDSPWLGHLLKLEMVRHAAIPYDDPLLKKPYTLLQCVERVRSVVALGNAPNNGWLPVRVDLDVTGVGRWFSDISILVEPRSFKHGKPEPETSRQNRGEY